MSHPVLELRKVTFRRQGNQILHGIDLTVRAGEHWALLGPNGAGKSTILGFCGAQSHPTSGTVDVLGRRLGRVDLQELRRVIGHVNPRHALRSPLTAVEVVLTGLTGTVEQPLRWAPSAEQQELARSLLADVGLAGRVNASWMTMSQGERGRTLIARALVSRPRLLLLDEPTTGLDVAAREQLLETIGALARSEPGLASVLVTHHLEELPVSTSHALVISHGRTVASGPVSGAVNTRTISQAFEHPIRVERERGRWSARSEWREDRDTSGVPDVGDEETGAA
ncbi:ABC transporter ATP-binding protein [Nocardioides sp. Iso805N]|uniref:ABC transporter ATP-binding protein n=1 Tax=Nocardioides sp. Iso805N TaxID=1283287 RepID=UPI00035DD98F|nr:ATP-binding cassette domain-containing protein [Nocardioides sp. Iso805N]